MKQISKGSWFWLEFYNRIKYISRIPYEKGLVSFGMTLALFISIFSSLSALAVLPASVG